jgi:hypothetical protein
MGIQLANNAPTFAVNGKTYAVSTSAITGFVDIIRIGLYVKIADGSFENIIPIMDYANSGDLVADVKARGGITQYLVWLKNKIVAVLQQYFGTPSTASTEPSTDAEAVAAINAYLATVTITMTNGIIGVK